MLAENPYVGKALHGDLAGFRSIKAWPFRIVYEIVEKRLVVKVLRIRHRKEAYK